VITRDHWIDWLIFPIVCQKVGIAPNEGIDLQVDTAAPCERELSKMGAQRSS
jgi:hypothetical protein